MRKRRRHFPLSRAVLLTAAFLVPSAFAQTAPATNALPSGGQVAAGQVTMATTGPAGAPTLNVTQGSDRAIVNWQSFDVGRDATVRFAQPSASSAILNRVVGTDASRIFGRVEANGQVFLVNPQGVYFSPTSSVDVGSFVASTLSIGDADFLAGRLIFRRDGATGSVVNEGSIRSALGGYVALLAPEVRNAGIILAQAGSVVLAAGEKISFNFDPTAGVTGLLVEPARVQVLVDNARIVRAPGGQVIVSAQAHNELAAGVIRNTGEISATGIAQDGGRVFLGASDAVEQGGSVDVSAAAGKGGDVAVTAPSIALLDSSSLLADGELGGGRIRVGGEWQGSGALPQSRLVTMAPTALVDASARRLGAGGEVVLWSDVHDLASRTQVAGEILARGGELGGDGGRVETSGRVLDVGALSVDTRATLGRTGDWLLDPVNITIAASGGNLTPTQLQAGLVSSNVSISTAGSGSATGVSPTYSAGSGDITISAAVVSTSANSLTLTADNNINLNASVSLGGAATFVATGVVTVSSPLATSAGDLTVTAAGFGGAGAITVPSGGVLRVTTTASSVYAGVLGGAGGLAKAGAGALALTGANTFTGGTTVTAGTLGLYHGTSLGTGALSIGGATLRFGRALSSVANNIVLTGATTFVFDTSVDYLLVGGGGGGGAHVGGGGGGGGVLSGSTTLTSGTSAISVGGGGTGSTNTNVTTRTAATLGGNTTAFGLTALGGGAGGNWNTVGATSGATGGGQGTNSAAAAGSIQGFAGGIGDGVYNNGYLGGGGGGAGGIGRNAGTSAGNGGIGVLSTITGVDAYYGGGGGGGVHDSGKGAAGIGGLGGGGNGAVSLVGTRAPDGTANTGGGGGGSGAPNNLVSIGGTGGSGIVVVSYLGAAGGTGGTVAAGTAGAAGRTLHRFTSTGADSLVLSALSTTLGGAITGTGALTVNATGGTIAFTGANTYDGTTTIAGGVLRVGAGGATGALGAGAITNNGSLVFNRTGTLTIASALSGTGSVEQLGTGVTVLSAAATHTGGTTVTAGTLRVGAGGTTGTLAGAVVTQGVLAFDRSDAFTFAGAISGAGGLTQAGTGSLVLTGAATYTGVTTSGGGGVVFRRDVPPTTSGFAGAGTVTIEPVTAAFTSAFTANYTYASTLTGLTLGKSGNTAAVTISSAVSIAGPIRIFGGDVTVSANLTSSAADQPVFLQATANILQGASRTLQTNGGDIVLWSNAGGATTGNRGILISDGSLLDARTAADRLAVTHTTGGGMIVLGGGSTTATSTKGTTIPTGYALDYAAVPSGLMVGSYNSGVGHNANVRMFSGGGDVVWRGRSAVAVGGVNVGISAFEGVTVNAGTAGDITIDGVSVGTSTWSGTVFHCWSAGTAASSYLTVDGDILINGSGSGVANAYGTQLAGAVGFPVVVAATGAGTVTIRGTGVGTWGDVYLGDAQLLSGSGQVSLLSDRAGGKLSVVGTNATAKFGQAAGSVVTASSASVLLRGDVFDVTATNGLAINTTGTVELTSFNTTGFTTASSFSRLDVGRAVSSAANSIASFTLGKTTNTSAITITAGGINVLGPIRMYGGDLTIGSALRTDAASAEILLQATGFLKTSANLTTTGATSPLRLLAGGYFHVTAASTWTTTGSDVLVSANTDGTGGGYILGSGNQSIVTSGGAVTLAGGNLTGTGYAEGMTTANAEGIRYSNALSIDTSVKTAGVSTGGGDIRLIGRSFTSAGGGAGAWGVGVDTTTTLDAGTGTIRIDGISQTSVGDSYNMGVRFAGNATMTSAATSATAIYVTGTGGAAASSYGGAQGIRFEASGNLLATTGVGGGIKLSGTGGSEVWAVVFQGGSILSSSGPIELSGTAANSYLYLINSPTIGFKAGTAVTSSTANILLSFFDASWSNTAAPVIATSGSFTFRPSGTSFNRVVGTSWFTLPTTLSGLTLGSATNTSGVYIDNNQTVQGPVTLQGGYVYVYNTLSAAGDILLDGDTGANLAASVYGVYVNAAVSTTAASNGSITLTGRGGNAGSNYGVYLTATGPLTAGGSGAISVTGIGGANTGSWDHGILVYSNLSTTTGAITLNGTGGGSGAGTYNRGIWLANASNLTIKTTTGAVTLIGTGGVGANSEAIYVHDGSTVTLGAIGQSGDITLRGNSLLIGTSTIGILTSGGLTIEPLGAAFTTALSTQKITLPASLAFANLGKAGNTGDITVTNAIATSGAITISGGAVALNGALSSTGGSIGLTTSALTGSAGITIPATRTLTITQSGNSTYGGAISGAGSLVKAGAGELALSASSGFTGATTISAGTLALGGGGTSGWLTGTSSIAVDGTLQIWRGDDVTLSLPLTGAGTIEIKGANSPLFSSYLTTTAQTIAANSTVAEVMRRITGGQLGGSAITGAPANAGAYQVAFDPVANVGRFQLQLWDGAYVKTVFARVVQNGANVQALIDQGGLYTLGTAYLASNQLGQDMATYAGVNYSMTLAASAGATGYGVARIDVAGKTTLSNIGSFTGNLKLTTATETGTGSAVYTRTIPGVLQVTSGFGAISGIVNNGLLVLNQAADNSLANTISGSGGLIKLGAGNTTFSAGVTFTGETTVATGRLTLQGAFGSSVHTIVSGATLALDTAVDLDYASTTFRGAGTLVKSGAGRALWGSSVATFALGSGAMIDVQGGIFTGSSSSNEVWTNNYADLNVASGARFAAVEGAVRVDALTGSGDITVGYAGGLGSLTVGVDNHTAGAFSTAGSASFSGVIADTGASATGAVTKLGTGTQVFTGANTYSRVTTISAGKLAITDAAGLGATAAGTTVASGATLDLRGVVVGAEALTVNGGTVLASTGTSSLSGAVTLGASSTVTVDGTQLTLSGIIGGATFGVTKTGAGIAILSGANTFSGDLTVSAGTLRIGGAGTLTAGTYVGAITVASGATFDFASSANQTFGAAAVAAASNTLRGAGTLLFGGTGTVTLRGDFSTTGAVEVSQAVTVTGGTNSWNAGLGLAAGIDVKDGGTITVGGGANSFIGVNALTPLTIRTGGKITTSGAAGQTFHLGLITLAGGELATGAGATTTIWGIYNLDRTITVTEDSTLSAQFSAMYQSGGTVFNIAAGKTLTVSGTLNLPSNAADTGLIVNSAAGSTGTLSLSGANTYSGGTTITRGTLKLSGAGTLGNGTYASTVANGGTLEFGTSATQTFSGVISGAGAVTQSGAGTTILTATNTYTGATTVSAGVLQVGNGGTTGALATSTAASVATGATLRYYRADVFPASISVAHPVSGDGTLEFRSTGGNGTGQFKLTGANTLSASAVILLNQARLIAETQADLSASLPLVRVMSGGQLYINRTGTIGNPLELGAGLGWKETDGTQLGILHVPAWTTAGAVTFSGNVTLTGNTSIAPWANSADVTLSGVIADGGNAFGFTKLGTLKLTLTGANTFTGSTTVSAGTLQVGAGGTTGVIGGAIVNNSALIFDRSDAITFAKDISGTGTLTKAGANTLTLTAAATYSGATTVTGGGIVFRRDVAPSTSGFAGAGSVTIESAGTAFTAAVSSYTYAATLTGLTLGKATNTSAVTLGSAVSIAGPVTVYGGSIAVNAAVSAAGDLLLDADTGAQLSGNFTGLNIAANLSTTSASNGNIVLRGRGGDNSAGTQVGVNVAAGVTVAPGGSGSLTLDGAGGSSVGMTNIGARVYGTLATGSGNLTVNGLAGGTGASSNNDGIAFMAGGIIRSVGGNVLLDATVGPGGSSESIAFETGASAATFGQATQTGSTTIRGDVLWVSTNNVSILGSGAVTIEPRGASFLSVPASDRFAVPSTAAGFTFGKAGNTAALTVAANLSVAGPIAVYGGDVTLTGGLAASAAGDVLVRSSGVLTIAAAKVLSTTNGDLTLTAGRLVNNAGSGALSAAGTGKTWRIWSTNADPYNVSTGDVAGSLAFDFRQYDASYGVTTVQGTGKGMLYSYAPTLAASLTTTPTKVYDRTDTATVTNAMVTVASGYAGGDRTAVFTFSAATYASRNAGDGQTITFASAPTVLAQSSAVTGSKPVYGYQISGLSAPTGNITPLVLTLTGVTAANKVYDRSLAATVSGGFVTPLSGDTVTVDTSSATGAFADWNVGTGKTVTVSGVVLGGVHAVNYTVGQPSGLTANITARPLNVTGVIAANKTYDRSVTATLSGGAVAALSGDTVTLVTSGRAGVFADRNVGDAKTVTVSGYALAGANAGNYAIVQPTGVAADIAALSLAVTGATAANKTYDALLGATVSGGAISVISGDDVTLDITSRAGVFANKNVGTGKAVTVSGYTISGTDAGNYALVQPAGVTANITALSLTIAGASAASKIYDRTLAAVVSGGTISPLTGDTVTLDASAAAGAFATKVVGTGKALTVTGYTIGGADAGNYAIVQPTGLTADITARALSITGASAANKTYDRLTTATITGGSISAIAGDTVTLVTSGKSGVFADWNVGTGKAVTVTGYSITGADAANYSLVQPTGVVADITPLSLAVTGATAANKTYDRLTAATISGGSIAAISGDDVTLDITNRTGVFANKNVATGKSVTVSGYTISGTDAGNYALVQPAGVTADITALSLAVTGATTANKTYDRSVTATLSGGSIAPLAGDTVTLVTSGRSGVFADWNVGTGKSVTASGYTLSGADAGNYAVVQPTGLTADITARPLTVTGLAPSKTYDRSVTASLSGATVAPLSGDTVSVDAAGASGSFADRNVATGKAVTYVGFALAGADAGNYVVVQPAGVVGDITPRSLTLNGATGLAKTYDGSPNIVNADGLGTLTGVLAGDDVSAAGQAVFDSANAGTVQVIPGSASLVGADAGNYAFTWVNGSATIQKAPLSVTANDDGRFVTQSDATGYAGVSYQGFVNGEGAGVVGGTLAFSREAGVAAGSYKLTPSGLTAANYQITYADGTYTIVPAQTLLIKVSSVTRTYGSALNLAPEVVQYLDGASVLKTLTLISQSGGVFVYDDGASGSASFALTPGTSVSTGGLTPVGNYNITPASFSQVGSNWVGNPVYTGVLTVAPKALSVASAAPTRAYDGTKLMGSVNLSLQGLVSGDVVTATAAGSYANRNAGTNKAYTIGNIAIAGADAANYFLSAGTISGTDGVITAKSVQVTGLTAQNKVYDGQLAANLDTSAVSFTGLIAGDSLAVAATAGFADKNVGAGKAVTLTQFGLTGSDAANYTAVQPSGLTADISALALDVTGASATSKAYDRLRTAAITGGSIAGVAGDDVTLVVTNRAGLFADKNAGTGKAVTVSGYTLSGTDAGNYALVQPTGITADITALTLNVTGATAATKTYDRAVTATISGGSIAPITGDTVTLSTSGRVGTFADWNVGTGKAVTVSGYAISGSDAGNYSLVQPTGVTADITTRSLAVTGATAANKTYDRLLTATISGGSIAPIAGDTVTLVTSGRAGTFTDRNVGTGKAVTVSGYTISGTDAGNYALVQPAGVTADITALSLAVTGATAANKTYDRAVAATISGGSIAAITGDTVILVTSGKAGAFADWNVGTGKSVTVSGYTISGTDAGNYALVQPASVTADITALSLAVTGASAANKTYDRLLTATISGGSITPITGDTVILDATSRSGVFGDKNVGTGKSVTVSGYTISGTDAGNYSLAQPTGVTADITALSLAVTGAAAANKTYDRLLTATISGGSIAPIAGDTVTLDDSGRAGVFANKNVGTVKAVTVSGYTISGADAGNYALVQPTGVTANISALSLAVTGATAANKTYDRAVTATISGGSIAPIAGDTVTLVTSGKSGDFADWNVGTGKSVTVSGYTLSGADAGNYALAQPTGITADITALSLAVTGATAANKTYDRLTAATITGGSIAPITGDTVTLDTSGRAGVFGDKNVGTGKSVTVSGYTLSGADAGNYALAQPIGVTADITALSLAVTGATAANKTYDRLITATVSGGSIAAITGDTVTLVTSGRGGVFGDKNIGTSKPITVSGYSLSGADAGNYALVQPTGVTADITALSLAVTGATAANKTYDRLLTATISGGSIAPIAGDTVALVTSGRAGAFADWNVGTGKSVTISGYTLSGADAGNYALVQPTGVTADIMALSLAVTGATAANKTYDRLLTATISGGSIAPITGDTVILDATSRAGVFGDKNVGTTKSVTISGYTLSGADAGNYALAQPTGVTADITALSLAVTGAIAANKTYDRLLTATISGGSIAPITGDTVSLDDSGRAGVFGDKNVGTAKSVTVSGYSLSGADAGNYSLVQPAGLAADIAALSLAVAGATAANKTYDALLGATISGGSIAPITGDSVTLDTSGRAGVFADKNVGTGKSVTVSGYTLSGSDAGNYALVQPTGVTADITALSLAVTGATAANKTYDRLLTATITGGSIAPITGDTVTLDSSSRAGVFGDKNVGTGKSVTVSGYSLSGADAGNYSLVQPAGLTADIAALSLAVTGATAANKTYDRLLTATISGGSIAPITGDSVTLDTSGRAGVFGDKNVGTGKTVTVSGYTISGSDTGNYALVQPTGLTADISALSLAVTGASAANKTYDALLTAALSGGSISALSGDSVILDTTNRTGVFGDKNVGTAKSVTVSGYTISGSDAGNYLLTMPSGLTATILARSLPVVGVTAANKLRNGSLAAEISGGTISPLAGDNVALDASAASGQFLDDLIGAGKPVVVSGFSLTGPDAGNYAIAQPSGVRAGINDAGIFYPPVVATPPAVFAQPIDTNWAPATVNVTLQGPAKATPQLVVSTLGMPSSPPDIVPVGTMLSLSTVGATPVQQVTVEIVGGFVAGDTLLQLNVPEGLKVSVDNNTGKVTISGVAAPEAYAKVLKTLAVRSAGGNRVGGLTLKVDVSAAQGGKSTTTVQLRQGGSSAAK